MDVKAKSHVSALALNIISQLIAHYGSVTKVNYPAVSSAVILSLLFLSIYA
jgi:hypothetical protein